MTSSQGQLAGLEEVLRKVATAMGKVVARTVDEENDMVEFAKDLGNIGSSASIFGDNDFFFEGSKEVARSEKRFECFLFCTKLCLALPPK